MAKGITFITLLLLFLTGCSERADRREFVEVQKEDLHEGSATFESAENFIEFTFECTAGKSYTLEFYQATVEYYTSPNLTITFPDGSIDSNYTFICSESGKYHFKITPPSAHDAWPYSFEYRLTEFSSLESALDNQWLFMRRVITAFDKSQTFTADRENAMRTLKFSNDSCIFTFYDIHGDTLYESREIFAESEYANSKYQLDSTTLTFTDKNPYGTYTDIYTLYSGTAEELTWEGEILKVPEDLLGTWYYSSNTSRSIHNTTGTVVNDSSSEFYSSGDESFYIISIMEDSVVTYNRGFGYVDSASYSIKEIFYFLQDLERVSDKTGDIVLQNEVNSWQSGGYYSVSYSCSEYKKYTGSDPASGWKTKSPSFVPSLELGEPFFREVEGGDSIWLELSLEGGNQYEIEFNNSTIGYYSSFFINASTMEPEYFTKFYSANATGKYYLVLFVYKSEDHSEIPSVSFSVKKYSFYD